MSDSYLVVKNMKIAFCNSSVKARMTDAAIEYFFTATADWQFFTAHSQEKLDTIQIWIYVFKCRENKGWQAKEETFEEKKNDDKGG